MFDRRALLQAGASRASTSAEIGRVESEAQAAGAIDVGVLSSLTGGLTIVEMSRHDAATMAMAEIDAAGDVLGEQVRAAAGVREAPADAMPFRREPFLRSQRHSARHRPGRVGQRDRLGPRARWCREDDAIENVDAFDGSIPRADPARPRRYFRQANA